MTTPVATGNDVRAINGSTLADPAFDVFLLGAACIMVSITGCTSGKGIDSDCLVQAEAWLACHLFSLVPAGKKTRIQESEKFEGYSTKWAMSTMQGQGVLSSTYGQMANSLVGGCLSEVDKTPALICSFG